MMTTTRDLAQEFQKNGFLHIRSMVKKESCEKLVYRMRDLVARFAPDDRAKILKPRPILIQQTSTFCSQHGRSLSFSIKIAIVTTIFLDL